MADSENHPKIHPNQDADTDELLAMWDAMDEAARADVLAVARGLTVGLQ